LLFHVIFLLIGFEIGQEKIESALFRFYLLATIMKVA